MSDIFSSFDINEMIDYLNKYLQYKNIGFQFSKNLKNEFQIDLLQRIKKLLKEKNLFIIGDSSYGNCCCDESTGLHLDCDIIIRVGNSCLTNNKKIPIYYLFENFEFSENEINILKNNLQKIINDEKLNKNNQMILFYDSSYLKNCILKIKEEKNNINDNINFSEILNVKNKEKESENLILYGRIFSVDKEKNNLNSFITKDSIICYIGNEDDDLLIELSLRFENKIKGIYIMNKNNKFKIEKPIPSYKIITRRFYLINQIKNCETFGILIGNLTLKNLKEIINMTKKLLKENNKKVYTILLGKITDEKLCNFIEYIDCFILLSCPFNEGYSKKIINKIIVSPLDIKFAFDSQFKWDSSYSFDIDFILENQKKLNYDNININQNINKNNNNIEEHKIQVKDYKNQALANIFSYQIIERYDNRKFKGLSDEGLEDEPIHKVIKGKRGIPIKYEKIKE